MSERALSKIRIDFRYVELEYELWALGHMLGVIEPAIARLAHENEATTVDELKRRGWETDEAEVDVAYQDIREMRDQVLPRFMRGPFVVSLTACYESGVAAVAQRLQDERDAPIALSELRGDSFLTRAHRYFDVILRLPLDLDARRYQRLGEMFQVRHAFAHANGRREGMSARQWDRLVRSLSRHGIDGEKLARRGHVVLSHAYAASVYDDVNSSLRSLIDRARAYPKRHAGKRKSSVEESP